jgi:hypothetical protein
MESPWEILGLDPQNISLRDLRRAYSQLIKQHRPDRDPEGFRRIHQAYEFLRMFLERSGSPGEVRLRFEPAVAPPAAAGRAPESPAAPAEPRSESGSAPPPDEPAAPPPARHRRPARLSPLAGLLREVRAARAAGQVEEGRRQLAEALAAWQSEPGLTGQLAELVAELAAVCPEMVLGVVGPEDCLAEGRFGSVQLIPAVLDLWAARGRWDEVFSFGGLLLAHGEGLQPETAVQAMVAAARALAIAHPTRAKALADAAYRLAPPALRAGLLDGLDLPLLAGAQMGSMLADTRRVIARCVASEKADPNDRAVIAAMRDLWYLGNSRLAQDFVFNRFPEIRAKTRPKDGGAGARAREAKPKPQAAAGSGRSYWWVVLLVVLAIQGARTCTGPLASPKPSSTYGPNRLNPEDMERIRKMLEQRPKPGDPQAVVDLLGGRYSGPLPEIYKAVPWMEPVRRGIAGSDEAARTKVRGLIRAYEHDPRRRVLLDTLSRDNTLPQSVREEVEQALNALGPPPAFDSPSAPRDNGPPGKPSTPTGLPEG